MASAQRTRHMPLRPALQAKRRISSVPLMPLCVRNVEVVCGTNFSLASLPRLQTAIADGRAPLLLFPGPGAVALPLLRGPLLDGGGAADHGRSAGLHRTASGEGPLLVLVDGTWAQARHMLRHSPEVSSACQHIMFATEVRSHFEALRREPAAHCMCTLEAAAYALRALGRTPDAGLAADYLEASLRELVSMQLRHAPPAQPRPSSAKRRAAQRSFAPPPT